MDWILQLGAAADIAPALLCGFIIGWLICFTGVGGGVLVLPALTFFFGLDVSVAVGTASVYTALTKIMAAAEHARIKNVNYPLFIRLTCCALPGLFLSAFTVNYLLTKHPAAAPLVQKVLWFAVLGAIALSLFLILRRKRAHAAAAAGLPATLAAGAGIGFVMGGTGIGGGVLIAPALLLLGRETAKRVVGTSILTALALSALTAVFYTAGGQIAWAPAIWMSAGSLLAVPVAGRTLRRVSEAAVQNTLLALIAIAALLMLAGGY